MRGLADLEGDLIAFDIETTGLDPRTGKTILVQLKDAYGHTLVLDVRGRNLTSLKKWLATKILLGHNLKFDLGWFYPLIPRGIFDTQVAEQVIWGLGMSDGRKQGVSFSLAATVERRLGIEMSKEERNWFIDLDQRPEEWNAPIPQAQLNYAALDVDVIFPLYEEQKAELEKRGLIKAATLEMQALGAIIMMEREGMKLDVEAWRAFVAEKEAERDRIFAALVDTFTPPILEDRVRVYDEKHAEYSAYRAAVEEAEAEAKAAWEALEGDTSRPKWGDFKRDWMKEWRSLHKAVPKPSLSTAPPNLDSPAQVLVVLHALGVDVSSTKSEFLKEYSHIPEVQLLLDYRGAAKFVDAFGERLLGKINPQTGRIHPHWVQIGASTGRMSCQDPNLQQIPSRGDGKRVRKMIVAPPGRKLLVADFSNVELRILAELSQDANMLAMFAAGKDLHAETARAMFHLTTEVDVETAYIPGTKITYREAAKTINFGLIYGMSANKLARTLKVTKEVAQSLLDAYFALYPGVVAYLERVRRDGYQKQLVRTLSGRLRLLRHGREPERPRGYVEWADYKEKHKEWKRLKARIERQAMNTPIQGSSADITKRALFCIHRELTQGLASYDTDAVIIAAVHDEIVLEATDDPAGLEAASEALANGMMKAVRDYLPTVAFPRPKVLIGDYWRKS